VYYVLLFYIKGKYPKIIIYYRRRIKKNTSGETSVRWEFYEICDDIFATDRTINIGPTISSFVAETPTENNTNIDKTTFSTNYSSMGSSSSSLNLDE